VKALPSMQKFLLRVQGRLRKIVWNQDEEEIVGLKGYLKLGF